MSDLPLSRSITRSVFHNDLTDSEYAAVEAMMKTHGVDIRDVAHIEIKRHKVVYQIFETDENGHRFVDPATGDAAYSEQVYKLGRDV
ncbi:hypothetical protein LCGC14_2938280 [marine sediment metagenome]|uniref:Uncharacterized protein n=1 Tax=marine sediment metagenome TaxID=412755 RepID=A0A0F8XJD6_9ZZZZ